MSINFRLFAIFFLLGTGFAKPIVFIHRGDREHAPENTLPGSESAFKRNCSIEFDINETQDEHYAVIHDKTLERTTNGTGYIRNHNLSELILLKAAKFHPNLSEVDLQHTDVSGLGYHIPSLHQLLQLAHQYKVPSLMMEIKSINSEHISHLVNFINHYWHQDIIYFSKSLYINELFKLVPSQTLQTINCLKTSSVEIELIKCFNSSNAKLIKVLWKSFRFEHVQLAKKFNMKVLLSTVGVDLKTAFSVYKTEDREKISAFIKALKMEYIDYICSDECFDFTKLLDL